MFATRNWRITERILNSDACKSIKKMDSADIDENVWRGVSIIWNPYNNA